MSDSPGHEDEDQFCLFSLKTCLPVGFFTNDSVSYSAEDMFIHMAFVEPECGDCMIKALITASGVRGLDAILPHPEQTAVPEERQRKRWERSEPMLPLVDRWQLGNFSLYSVIRPNQDQWEGTDRSVDGSINLRQWSIKLLSRYAYVLGESRSLWNDEEKLDTNDRVNKLAIQLDPEHCRAFDCGRQFGQRYQRQAGVYQRRSAGRFAGRCTRSVQIVDERDVGLGRREMGAAHGERRRR